MKQRNGKSTTYSAAGDTLLRWIFSSNWPVTTLSPWGGNRRTTLTTPNIWLTNFTKSYLIDYGNRGMELESCGTEETEAVRTFHLYSWFSSLLFISSLDFGQVHIVSAQGFTTCQWRWSFPVRRIQQKIAIELYRSVARLLGSYNCVRRMNVSFPVSLSISSLILASAAQEICAKRGGIM